jgi:hypothetical protein
MGTFLLVHPLFLFIVGHESDPGTPEKHTKTWLFYQGSGPQNVAKALCPPRIKYMWVYQGIQWRNRRARASEQGEVWEARIPSNSPLTCLYMNLVGSNGSGPFSL